MLIIQLHASNPSSSMFPPKQTDSSPALGLLDCANTSILIEFHHLSFPSVEEILHWERVSFFQFIFLNWKIGQLSKFCSICFPDIGFLRGNKPLLNKDIACLSILVKKGGALLIVDSTVFFIHLGQLNPRILFLFFLNNEVFVILFVFGAIPRVF